MLEEGNLVRIRQTSRTQISTSHPKLGERDIKVKKDALKTPDIGLIYHSLFQLLLSFGPQACQIARVTSEASPILGICLTGHLSSLTSHFRRVLSTLYMNTVQGVTQGLIQVSTGPLLTYFRYVHTLLISK